MVEPKKAEKIYLGRKTQSLSAWKQYKKLKKEIQRECRKAQNQFTNRMISGQHQGKQKKFFYKFIKALRKDPCSITIYVKDGLSDS